MVPKPQSRKQLSLDSQVPLFLEMLTFELGMAKAKCCCKAVCLSWCFYCYDKMP